MRNRELVTEPLVLMRVGVSRFCCGVTGQGEGQGQSEGSSDRCACGGRGSGWWGGWIWYFLHLPALYAQGLSY